MDSSDPSTDSPLKDKALGLLAIFKDHKNQAFAKNSNLFSLEKCLFFSDLLVYDKGICGHDLARVPGISDLVISLTLLCLDDL